LRGGGAAPAPIPEPSEEGSIKDGDDTRHPPAKERLIFDKHMHAYARFPALSIGTIAFGFLLRKRRGRGACLFFFEGVLPAGCRRSMAGIAVALARRHRFDGTRNHFA
jgi:hypothetical protein